METLQVLHGFHLISAARGDRHIGFRLLTYAGFLRSGSPVTESSGVSDGSSRSRLAKMLLMSRASFGLAAGFCETRFGQVDPLHLDLRVSTTLFKVSVKYWCPSTPSSRLAQGSRAVKYAMQRSLASIHFSAVAMRRCGTSMGGSKVTMSLARGKNSFSGILRLRPGRLGRVGCCLGRRLPESIGDVEPQAYAVLASQLVM